MKISNAKRKILNVLIILILALSFTLVTAAPAAAATTINVPADQPTIQAAIIAASPGDTINVAAGTYNEMLIINKSGLTLRGANAGVHPVVGTHPTETPGARGAETILSHNGLYAINPQADSITVDGFKFTGAGGRIIDTYADANGFHLTNCIFDNPSRAATQGVIQFGGGSHTDMLIDFNLFQDQGDHTIYTGGGPFDRLRIAYNKFNGYGDGVFWTATPLVNGVIEYNEFDGTIAGIPGEGGTGLNIGQGGNIAIRKNWFHDMYYTGFQVGIIGGSVIQNTFENMYPIESGGTWYPSDAFQLWGGEWGTPISTDVTISGNTIVFNQQSTPDADENGLRLRPGCDAANIHVNLNDFINGGVSPTAFAVRNQGTGTLDAENNWWDTDSEPDIQSLLSGNIDYDPWIVDPDASDYEYIGDGGTGTLNIDGSEVDVDMNDGQSGSFSATARTGAPTQGFAGMGGGSGLNKSIVVETNAADGTYIAVIKLGYTDAELLAAGIDEDDLRLYYWDTAGLVWKLAVEGNVGPTNDIRWMGDSAPAAATAANLGMHGVDKTNNIAWAVVDHNTDYSAGVGPVEAWVDDDYDAGNHGGHGWHIQAFDSIQDAIDSCAAGAIIYVYPGDYPEALDINKPVTLYGLDAGDNNNWTAGTAGAGVTAPTITYDGITAHMININADNITMQGLRIDTANAATRGIYWTGTRDNTTIRYSSFTANDGDRAISLSDGNVATDFTITYCSFDGTGPMNWFAVGENGGCSGNNTLSYNDIDGLTSPLFLGTNNIYDITYANNSFSNVADGIYLHKPGAGVGKYGDILLESNTFAGGGTADYAFLILGTVAAGDFENNFDGTDVVLRYNNILIMASDGVQEFNSVQSPDLGTLLDARFNYWNSNTGPTHASNPLGVGADISDYVAYQPWMDNGQQPSGDFYIDALSDANTEVIITGTGGHIVGAGRWSHNPDSAYPDFMVVGGYFIDVFAIDITGISQIEIRFHYSDEDILAGLEEPTLRMKWWNGTSWQKCSNSGVNSQKNYVWAIITADTSPNLTQLTGTPFSATGQRVVIPSLSSWGALVLVMLLLGGILWVMRRKKVTVREAR